MNNEFYTLELYISAAESYLEKNMPNTAHLFYKDAATLFNLIQYNATIH